MAALTKVKLCQLDDLMPFIGATVLIEGEHVALFYIPDSGVYAVQDWDPIGKANVMSRGIVGDIDGEMCVASPLYQPTLPPLHDPPLALEDEAHGLKTWQVTVDDNQVCHIVEE
ncbi:nitrite reductase small subunit NirD [Vibrio alginolyticus]|uniref:nitrite reductase small subunit NirD n=1 Tax=Vibrio alginolyticus TaxID=663 RepID=UPI001EEC1F8A|nr:nitrite reductase small subunit NirD [Vibrio alginolyticus]MCG6353468.1 nitrite reductase small subunit NirD [Vibrio alginolyticus]